MEFTLSLFSTIPKVVELDSCKISGETSAYSASEILPSCVKSHVESNDGFELVQPHSEEKPALSSERELSFDPYGVFGPAKFGLSPADYFEDRERCLSDHLHQLSLSTFAPNPFPIKKFIADIVIPSFRGQTKRNRHQFAVVLLLSETDRKNIDKVEFNPQDYQGKPFIDSSKAIMPQTKDYCNYIVACPTFKSKSRGRHSEEKIFGKSGCSDSRFDVLWDSYVGKHLVGPDYILIYSWYLPCCECADVIINSLSNSRFKGATVILAHTKTWSEETSAEHKRSKNKLDRAGIGVEKVHY